MFDLITGKVQHVPSTPAIPILISTSVQGTAFAVIVLASFLVATRELPPVPDMMAFVADLPAVVPPPPPPPPAAPTPSQPRAASPTAAPVSASAAPIEAPATIEPELPSAASMEEGVPGGVPGGIAAGIVGGIPGTVEGLIAPPPPVSHQPVRIGGQIETPALIHRVEPIYPLLAQMSKIDGVVILEAIVGEDGHVRSVKVLRGHPILGKAATDAVAQWQYEPLRLNSMPAAFELTVSLWFHFDDKPKRRL
jgi:TonB family protein